MSGRAETGVSRRVVFQAFCRRGRCSLFGWRGLEFSVKGDSLYELALHETNEHGGRERGEGSES